MQKYEQFLKDFDVVLNILFENQKQYINCKKGCSICCGNGDYPMSQIEFWYLTKGFINLAPELKSQVQQNVKKLIQETQTSDKFEHRCPFLINCECCVYKFRPIICRTFGLCYYDEIRGYVRLPKCVEAGLNYSKYYDPKTKILNISDVPKINLSLDRIFNSELAKKYDLTLGEIRPMVKWFSG